MEMVNKKLKLASILISVILLFALGCIFYYQNIKKTIAYPSDIEKGVERYWNKDVTIRSEKDVTIYGRTFKLVLSTAADDSRYKYFNCFEQKLGGLYYKCYQGAEQGGSNALINFTVVFISSGDSSETEKEFTAVYGYNEDLKIDSYGIKVSSSKDIVTSKINDREYFIDTFPGEFANYIECTGKDGSDMIKAFLD